jgi:uncharacterized protein DUF4397
MMKVFSNFKRSLFAGFAIVALAVSVTSCMKKGDSVDTPSAAILTFNLAPDQHSVVVALSGSNVSGSPLGFGSYSGIYRNIYIGNRTVESFDYPDSAPLASVDYNFEKDKYYSAFVVGAAGHYRNVVAVDNFDSLNATSGNAYIRYINAITDSVSSPAVSITAGSNPVSNANAAYASVSEFKAVAPGEVTIAVKSGSAIDVNRTITVEAKKVYTVLLVGMPGETDEAKKVQIRFVQNGTLTNEAGGK